MALPNKGLFGDPLAPGSVGPRQVVANPASKTASPPIQVNKMCRNGKHPSAQLWSMLQEATNQGAIHRTKEYFSCIAPCVEPLNTTGTSDRDRWRFAFRTGPYMHACYAVVAMVPTSNDLAYSTNNTQCKLIIYSDASETTAVSTTKFTYGVHPLGTSGTNIGWQHTKVIHGYIEGLSTNTEYYARFVDMNGGIVQSACVFELQSMTEHFSGYLTQNFTSQTEICDVYREKVATLQKALWKQGGAKVLNWTLDNGASPLTITGATQKNIIDQTSTTVSASTPGWTLDMTGKDRLSQTSGVPVTMKAFGQMDLGVGAPGGAIYLKDSTGATVASVTNFTGTASWRSTTFNLPATSAKYDIHFSVPAAFGTFKLWAVSIYEYEA